MNFSFFSITFLIFLFHHQCQASFLLDINAELNPIDVDHPNDALPTEFETNLSIPETIAMNMNEKEKYQRSFKELMGWMNQRLRTRNMYLTMKIAKLFKHLKRHLKHIQNPYQVSRGKNVLLTGGMPF